MKTMIKCILREAFLAGVMLVGMVIGMFLLLIATAFLSLRIVAFIFGNTDNNFAVMVIWFGMILIIVSLVMGFLVCRIKVRKLHGKKNPKAIDEL